MPDEVRKTGSIVHVEIPCKDRARAKKFYGQIFGWKFDDVPEMDYTLFEPANPPGGGLYIPTENMPGGVLNYFLVDSVDGTSKQIEKAGGTILMPKREVPNMGWFAVFKDPEGNVQAIWQSAPTPQE